MYTLVEPNFDFNKKGPSVFMDNKKNQTVGSLVLYPGENSSIF